MRDQDALVDSTVIAELRLVLGAGLMSVLDTFTGQVREAMHALPALHAADDHEALRALAHRLKGASGAVGARALLAEVTVLEHAAKDGDVARIATACERLPMIATSTLAALATH